MDILFLVSGPISLIYALAVFIDFLLYFEYRSIPDTETKALLLCEQAVPTSLEFFAKIANFAFI